MKSITSMSRSIRAERVYAPWGVSGVWSPQFRFPSILQSFARRHRRDLKPTSIVDRTANAAEPNPSEMRISGMMSANAASIATIPDGEWGVIATFGDHPSPDGKYIQRFGREQSDQMVANWNSFTGKCARLFKNMWHGLGAKFTAPVWEGHPDDDPARFPISKLLAEVEDVRTANAGIEGKIRWNPKGMASRESGPLYPTVYWFHDPPSGDPPAVFPALLASVGLWPTVNIKGVPAWTSNAAFPDVDASSEAQSTTAADTAASTANAMNEEQLKALRKALNLSDSTPVEKVIETAQSAFQLSTSNATALTTANAAKADVETQLQTANAEKQQLTTEVAQLKTANTTLTDGILDLFEEQGKFTPAERAAMKGQFTANVANSAAVITELKEKKPALNTKQVELNGKRLDISTANARQAALSELVSREMADAKCDYGTAFDRVLASPQNKQLIDAMGLNKKETAAA